jgi:uncharacterized membrane protein
MAKQTASITVSAPVAQVYRLFTRFDQFPKFMSHVKEVTYVDERRTHWVADILGTREWDAVTENSIPERQIGWRSIDGVAHRGTVTFVPLDDDRTDIHVEVEYEPPAGALGSLGEALGGGAEFARRLQHDLDHFAQMVYSAPPGALDPTSSSYLFHDGSAAARSNAPGLRDSILEHTAEST